MKQKVAFLDLRITDEKEKEDLLKSIEVVFSHGRIILGPEVQQLEKQVAKYCHRKYAIGVNSGTDALYLGLKGFGLGSGDEVITTSLSWIATASTISLNGATPVFADIGDDLNINPESIQRMITPKTKAILLVDYTGKICKMDEIREIAEKHSLLMIEDSAQSFGAKYHGKMAGSFGDIACFSMNPMKVFAACGEAGMIVTDNEEAYEKLISLRYHGTINQETCIEPSHNGRLDTLQAAILIHRLKRLDGLIERRRKNALWYQEHLSDFVRTPDENKGCKDVYYTYTIQAQKRDELMKLLGSKGIETKIQHPILMPYQPIYKNHRKDRLVNAKRLVKEILCIPANEKIKQEEMEYIATCIRRFYNG